MIQKFTHKNIVDIAYKWILKNGRIGVAFKELKSIDNQIPDVIGFDGWQSILIECKVSRSDFLADKKKPHHDNGMGNWRFYCCPKDIIKVSELPKSWGLIYIDEKGKAKIEYDCRIKKEEINHDDPDNWYWKEKNITHRTVEAKENFFNANMVSERRIMYSALRRLQIRGRIDEIYQIKNIQ